MNSSLRYGFGKNWQRFLSRVNQDKISLAEQSLAKLLQLNSLQGKTFLDIGCGSGLFSLAALRLGAKSVYSFDYDSNSVTCSETMRSRFSKAEDISKWKIEQGSILDQEYLKSLPISDIVYSWGVLHHTGSMWEACENADSLVAPGGLLAIAIYNDQGVVSKWWTTIKRLYNRGPHFQLPIIISAQLYLSFVGLIADLLVYRRSPLRRYQNYQDSSRGMSRYTDLLDWLGGYPFEVASPEAIFHFFQNRGYSLENLTTVGGGLACNEFVFRKK
ncbi:MAG: class I SAM-dependent methyltransferase [Bdellovibrionales bacterium]|nr:class I SAM-dependent methyltransferase [Bdellovibrionales bacterium]